MNKDLLFEIGTEEIPARFMPGALTQFETMARTKLSELRISCGQIKALGTPRRLTLIVRSMDERQADKKSENKGPAIKIAFDESGSPTKAAQGFARGQGVDVSSLVVRDGYVYAVVEEKGRPVQEILPELLLDMINTMTFPKNMRWANLDMRFVRPIRWLVALFDGAIVPFEVAGVKAGNITRGHRFLSKGEIIVNSVDQYLTAMRDEYVMLDQDERRAVIRRQVEEIAVSQGGTVNIDEELLEEVVHLVEYPTALCGTFEEKYLALPPEAVITPMREHQRYFPVVSQEGKLLPVFITVRNGGAEHIDIIKRGNERVLKARLADASFFFEEDKKIALIDRLEKLKAIVFQEGLGTLYEKVMRIEALALFIAQSVNAAPELMDNVSRAAKLAKADLVTGMVYEFTELQGIMGREYAKLNGENEIVAQAIYEHYLPRFAGDVLPRGLEGRAIGIADKIDNIVATFSRGLIPTGSQDPYALRRQALGIVNILIDAGWSLSISTVVLRAMDLLNITDEEKREFLSKEIHEFFRLRVKNILTDETVRYDIIDAVIVTGVDDVYDAYLRGKALAAEADSECLPKVVQAFTRAGNLAKNASQQEINPEVFVDTAEKALHSAYTDARAVVANAVFAKDYSRVIAALVELTEPINEFFAAVMVMDKDEAIRNNRLALLRDILKLAEQVGDLNKIVSV